MSEPYLVGLDFGGGGGRCLVLGIESGRVLTASRSWRFAPDPAQPIATSFDASETWSLLCEAAREALEQTMEEARELRRQQASQIVVPEMGAMPGGAGGPGGGKIQMP